MSVPSVSSFFFFFSKTLFAFLLWSLRDTFSLQWQFLSRYRNFWVWHNPTFFFQVFAFLFFTSGVQLPRHHCSWSMNLLHLFSSIYFASWGLTSLSFDLFLVEICAWHDSIWFFCVWLFRFFFPPNITCWRHFSLCILCTWLLRSKPTVYRSRVLFLGSQLCSIDLSVSWNSSTTLFGFL